MSPQEMLTELQDNYQILKAQFKQADLSKISPTKLAELMYKHLMAMQKIMQFMARPQDPPAPPEPSKKDRTDKEAAVPAPAPTPATPPAPQSKIQNLKSKIAPSSIDPVQYLMDRIRERPECVPPGLARKLGLSPAPPSRKDLDALSRPAATAPSRASPR